MSRFDHTDAPRHPLPVTRQRRSAERPLTTGRWLRRLILTGAVGAGLAVSGCGASSSGPVILNTEKVERAIEQSSLTQRHIRVQVSCPSGVHQTKGLAFFCTAAFKGGTTQFGVSEADGAGNVRYVAR